MSEAPGMPQRIKGRYEGVIGLPDALISRETKERLKDLGISNEKIHQLSEEILPSFNYGALDKRLEDLVSKPVFREKVSSRNEERIYIPNFFSFKGGGYGQCGDLTLQLISNGKFQSWIEDINEDIAKEGGNKINLTYAGGNSRTHFTVTNHIWAGIYSEGSDPKRDMVIIDPAFQEISEISHNGYFLNWWMREPMGYSYPLEASIRVTLIKKKNNKEFVEDFGYAILGNSQTSNCIYGLGFISKKIGGDIDPFIVRLYSDGRLDAYKLNQEDMVISLTDNIVPLSSESEKDEIANLLKIAKKFEVRSDFSTFPHPRNQNLNVGISPDYAFEKKKVKQPQISISKSRFGD